MSRGVNKVLLLGNLGSDPEVINSEKGTFTKCTLATSDHWTSADGKEQSRTEWHNIVAYNRLGEILAQYCKKGSKVFVEGSIRTNKYTDKRGNDKFSTQIVARELQMLDSKSSTSGDLFEEEQKPRRQSYSKKPWDR